MGLAELTVRYQEDCAFLEAPREVCLLATQPLDAALSPHSQSLLLLKLAMAGWSFSGCLSLSHLHGAYQDTTNLSDFIYLL